MIGQIIIKNDKEKAKNYFNAVKIENAYRAYMAEKKVA